MVAAFGNILPVDLDLAEKFCAAPFAGICVETDGSLLPCCDYKPHKSSQYPTKLIQDYHSWWQQGLQPLRQSMIAGPTDGGCQSCVAKESNPNEAHVRHWTNYRVKHEIKNLVRDHDQSALAMPQLLELRLGNLCNLGCIMCHSHLSSTIATEHAQHADLIRSIDIAPVDSPRPWWKDDANWAIVIEMVKTASYLHFSGGEPFMNPRIIDVLDSVSDRCVQISFNTNMTKLDDVILERLRSMPGRKVFLVSLEGVGAHAEYVRWPCDWDEISRAFGKVDFLDRIDIYHTLQHTSVFALPALVDWAEQRSIEVLMGRVYPGSVDGSGMMTLDSVGPADHARFLTWLDSYEGPHFGVMRTWAESYRFDQDLHERYRRYVGTLDSIRGTNFDLVFQPSWHERPARALAK